MVKQREKFWEYAEDLRGRFKCKFCQKEFTGGITRIKSHLSGVRGRDIEICSNVREDVRFEALQAIVDVDNKKDRIWDYVENLNGQLLCKFCKQSFAMDMRKIKSHFSGVRGTDIEICQKVPEAIQSAALEAMGAPNKKAQSSTSTSTSLNDIVGEAETISTSAPNKKAKTLHQPAVCNKDKSTASDILLAKFLISNNLPLAVSETPFLADLVKSIAEFGPTYELPNYLALKSQLKPHVEKEIEEYVGNVKRSFKKTGCTLLMSRVDLELESVNFFACSPAGLVYVDKITVSEERLALQHFVNGIYGIIESLGAENVVQCVIDDYLGDWMPQRLIDSKVDDFFSSVEKKIRNEYPGIYISRCASFEIYCLLDEKCIDNFWHSRVFQRATLIFKYLHKHDTDLIPRRNHTRNWPFNLDIPLIAEFYVLHSILEIEKEIKALQLPSDENVVYKAIHSTEFWSNGKTVLQVLQPIFQVLELVDCNVSTSGYLYDAMKKVENAFKEHCEDDEETSLEFKFTRNCKIPPMHAAAAFLNPAYMCSQNFTEGDEIQNGLELLMSLVPAEEREALLKQIQLYRIKESDLFTATAVEMLNKLHPRKWWERFGDRYPILQKYAIRILSQTCSTSLCYPILQKNDLVDGFSMNMIMMENFRLRKSQSDLEPIAVDRISGLPKFADHEYVLRNI